MTHPNHATLRNGLAYGDMRTIRRLAALLIATMAAACLLFTASASDAHAGIPMDNGQPAVSLSIADR